MLSYSSRRCGIAVVVCFLLCVVFSPGIFAQSNPNLGDLSKERTFHWTINDKKSTATSKTFQALQAKGNAEGTPSSPDCVISTIALAERR